MSIEKITVPSANLTASEQSQKELLGTREDFLTLLLAQLKHQDPLSPMKGTEFIDSITRLSSVEQSINQTSVLEKIEKLLIESNGGNEIFGAPVSYLDKNVSFESPAFNLNNGEAEFFYILDESPAEIFVVIRDLDGEVVRKANGTTEIGKNVITWDGEDDAGNQLDDGEYFIEIDYLDRDNELVSVTTITSGIVTGANFEGDEIALLIGNIKTTLDKIVAIRSTTN